MPDDRDMVSSPVQTNFLDRSSCPICNSKNLRTLFNAPYSDRKVHAHVASHYEHQGTVDYNLLKDINFTVVKCRHCALIYQRMAPTGPMLGILYGTFIDADRLKIAELSTLTIDNFTEVSFRLIDLFRTIGKEPHEISMLDFGFGYGRWARVAVGMGVKVYATEVTPEKIEFAQSIGVEILSEAQLSHYQFDVIHAEQIFEHLAEPVKVFDLLSKCLRPGGVFKISVPKQGRIESLLKRHGMIDYSPYARGFKGGMADYQSLIPLEHVNVFRRSSIDFLAQRNNFVVRRSGYGGRHVNLDVGSLRALYATGKQWGIRIAKDLYNHIGPGRTDHSCYLLYRDKQFKRSNIHTHPPKKDK
jgi:2-polyprenyl-3-methyl-5-hydroxy-6-metoxy-1,4-benzoquinol methylase